MSIVEKPTELDKHYECVARALRKDGYNVAPRAIEQVEAPAPAYTEHRFNGPLVVSPGIILKDAEIQELVKRETGREAKVEGIGGKTLITLLSGMRKVEVWDLKSLAEEDPWATIIEWGRRGGGCILYTNTTVEEVAAYHEADPEEVRALKITDAIVEFCED